MTSESAPQVTAEEQAESEIMAAVEGTSGQRIALRKVMLPILTRLVSAAKREGAIEAHLQDARDGCYFCGGNGPDYAETPVPCGGGGWEHQHMSGTQSTACARPEVWDALSALRSKGGAEPEGGGR